MSDNATKYVESRDTRANMVDNFVQDYKSAFKLVGIDPPVDDDTIMEGVSDLVTSMELMERCAQIYRDLFTPSELDELLAFSESAVGRKHMECIRTVINSHKTLIDEARPVVMRTLDMKFRSKAHFLSAIAEKAAGIFDGNP